MTASGAIVGLLGCGVTGARIAAHAHDAGLRIAAFDTDPLMSRQLARQFSRVIAVDHDDVRAADVVVIAHPQPHCSEVGELVADGTPVVSTSDAIDDLHDLLQLHDIAVARGVPVVIGAAMAPGLSGLLARSLALQLHQLDELHVAMHGTGGPACARQHHDALGGKAMGWHDGEWIDRPGGSGRELCWFPEPVGPHDCYRAALGDPLLLHRSFPDVLRISARVSGTRRDRLTARLPMLTPPHREGDLGAVRVEARGADRRGARITLISGAAAHTADLAAATAASAAFAIVEGRVPAGIHSTGDAALDPAGLLHRVAALGLRLQEYTGVARPADALMSAEAGADADTGADTDDAGDDHDPTAMEYHG